ncbi:MAG TPA: AAA family ATPase [Candidatus Binatus sp.]|nr:AAA family ATPase [Candidatus Binatus sp.]
MIITISGYHGTGKTTYAARLAKHEGLRHVSAGALFRKLAKEKGLTLEELGQLALKDPSIDRLIDEKTMAEAEKGNVVIDGQISGWILKEIADLRIYLTTPDNIRIMRIAERDRLSLEEAKRQTINRERVQSERYKLHYGFKVEDRSIYNLILDTSIGPIDQVTRILVDTAEAAKTGIKKGNTGHGQESR